jgi:hypothetical protein
MDTKPMLTKSSVNKMVVVLPTLLAGGVLLGGCTASTTVLSSANPSRAPASQWADYESLPVAVRGVVPGYTKGQLVSLFRTYHAPQYASLGDLPASQDRRMALYINPAEPLNSANLCDGHAQFQRGVQQGQSAYVVGALCDGTRVITTATANILASGQSPQDLAYNFNTIRDQLYRSLYPGANDPDRYYEGF